MSDSIKPIGQRIIAVGIVWNSNKELLLCKMSPNRGVFPGQWGLPGGGVERGESIEDGFRREMREEIGVEIDNIEPAFFKDGTYEKTLRDGSKQDVYMVFLLFNCTAVSEDLILNDEFVEYKWIAKSEVKEMDLNVETVDTLKKIEGW